MNEKRILFLDIDGTLTLPGEVIPPPSALEAVRRAQENGHLVFLCSGRNFGSIRPLLSYGFDGVIASAGGYVRLGERVLYDAPMSASLSRRAMTCLAENGIFRTVECLEESFTDEAFARTLSERAPLGLGSEAMRWRRQIEQKFGMQPMARYAGQPVYKIVMMAFSARAFAEPKRKLGASFAFCMSGEKSERGIYDGELIPHSFDKGRAAQIICREMGIPMARAIGFGDSVNDLALLQAVGTGVCMCTGSPQLKQEADLICPGVEEDGLYQAFSWLGLLG